MTPMFTWQPMGKIFLITEGSNIFESAQVHWLGHAHRAINDGRGQVIGEVDQSISPKLIAYYDGYCTLHDHTAAASCDTWYIQHCKKSRVRPSGPWNRLDITRCQHFQDGMKRFCHVWDGTVAPIWLLLNVLFLCSSLILVNPHLLVPPTISTFWM